MDSVCQMDILWHYHYKHSMDGAQVGVFKEACQIVLGMPPAMLGWCAPTNVRS